MLKFNQQKERIKMKEPTYRINDVIYFIHGSQIVKGVIDEFILHYTQEKVLIKYIIRPYGLKDYVTIDESKIYIDIDTAKQVVLDQIKSMYTKDNIKANYEEAKKTMEEKFNNQLNSFDELLQKALDNISSVSDKYYDVLEAEYQKTKENKDA
jgi:hypothetical protein